MNESNVQRHVVSFELAQELKKAGWVKETLFMWSGEFLTEYQEETDYSEYRRKYLSPAPLATELLAELFNGSYESGYTVPMVYKIGDQSILHLKNKHYCCKIVNWRSKQKNREIEEENDISLQENDEYETKEYMDTTIEFLGENAADAIAKDVAMDEERRTNLMDKTNKKIARVEVIKDIYHCGKWYMSDKAFIKYVDKVERGLIWYYSENDSQDFGFDTFKFWESVGAIKIWYEGDIESSGTIGQLQDTSLKCEHKYCAQGSVGYMQCLDCGQEIKGKVPELPERFAKGNVEKVMSSENLQIEALFMTRINSIIDVLAYLLERDKERRGKMKKPNNAPIYACMYQDLAVEFHNYGYALAVHGSVARDFDLVAVPWQETVSMPQTIINNIISRFSLKQIGEPQIKRHGRLVYTISLSYGDTFLDISFTPIMT